MLVLFVSIFAIILSALFIGLYLVPRGAFVWWNVPVVFIASWVGVFLLFVLFLVFIASLHSKKSKVVKPKRIYTFFIYPVAVFLRWLFNIRVVFENKEILPKDGKFLLVLNHQSMLDPIVAISCLKGYDVTFIVKDSIFRVPFVGRYLHAAGFIPLDRRNDRKALENILIGVKRLEWGGTLAIYPEGTRSRGPALKEFRDGAFKPALKAKVPIVIMALDGFYKKRVRIPLVPAKVYMKICEVLPYEEIKDLHTSEISDHTRKTIIANLEEARARFEWLK